MSAEAGSTIQRALTPAMIEARLETYTPDSVALSTGSAVTVASWLVDSYGSRGGRLVLTKSDGSRITRDIIIDHDGTSGADATVAHLSASGLGTHADIATTGIDADVSGTGTAQLARLRVTAAANGSSWSATFYPDFLKAA